MHARLDSDLLRTFAAIADSGSFTRAAERVNRTQSAVSMQMRRLEDAVGQMLFLRAARGVQLTQHGESLLTRARSILSLLDQTTAALRDDPLDGAVRVGLPEEYGTTVLPAVLARFAETHPAVQVTVQCESTPLLERAVSRGALDLAVLVIDSGRADGEILLHDPTVWVTSSQHAVHEQDPLPLAMFEQDCWWRDWALKTLDDRGRRYRIAYTSRSVAGLQAAVTSGLAVAVLGQSTMPPDTRVLASEEGFTNLPGSSIVLLRAAKADGRAIAGMAGALREAFRGETPPRGERRARRVSATRRR